MTNWAELQDAYGSAEDLPAILDHLTPGVSDDCWDELWSRACHQGSVYSASAPVLPHLLAAARRWSGKDRLPPLMLAGAIVVSQDRHEGFDLAPFEADIAALAALARETVAEGGWQSDDFAYLLQATLALEGDIVWGQTLDRLAEGEFTAACPACHAALDIEVGADGGRVMDDSDAPSEPIVARAPAALVASGTRLHRWALAAGQPDIAARLLQVFGQATCPRCRVAMSVDDAIASEIA